MPRQQRPQDDGSGARKVNWGALLLWILLIGVFLVPWMGGLFDQEGEKISYTEFRKHVQQGKVAEVTVKGETLEGKLADEPGDQAGFVTYLPSFGDQKLMSMLEENGVTVHTKPARDSSWLGALIYLLPIVFMVGLGVLMWRGMKARGQGMMMGFNRSRARQYDKRQEQTTFDDVAGARSAKTELREIVEFLRHPEKFHDLGGKTPRGVLLLGPPGTGKTLLARAVAGEANVPFFSITGSDFMEMFVGVGASRVRSMFEDAKKVAPAILFIDELDSIGRQRGAGLGGGHDEREQTLNQLLSELDGFEPNQNVVVMAATNRPDILDPALLRPGRFDRRVTVDLPTLDDRRRILAIHARNKPIEDEQVLDKLARSTPGFSGADLENLLNEAALLAARNDKEAVGEEEIEEARDKIVMGLERESLALTEGERRMIACHEAGHAVVAGVLPHADPVHKVTIVPRGRAMGATHQLPERDRYIHLQEYMLDRLAVMMGGRAAERLVAGKISSGVENDLGQATRLARDMVTRWGMSEKLGNVALGGQREHVFLGEEIGQQRPYSEATAREVDEEVKRILDDAFRAATRILEEHRAGLDRLVEELLENEELDGARVLELLGSEPREREPARAVGT